MANPDEAAIFNAVADMAGEWTISKHVNDGLCFRPYVQSAVSNQPLATLARQRV
jgi:hypothetical protein